MGAPSCIPKMPIYYKTFTARNFNTNPLDITGLKGDIYDYTLIEIVADGAQVQHAITFNNDTTSNYRRYLMRGRGSTASADVNDSVSFIYVNYVNAGNISMGIHRITGSSGDERYIQSQNAIMFATGQDSEVKSCYWKNTVDEISSIQYKATSSETSDVTLALFATPKGVNTENWELIEEKSFTSQDLSTNPIDFTVNGNRDIKYKLSVSQDNDVWIRLNNDSGTNYIRQIINNNGGTIQAANSSSLNRIQPDFTIGDFIIHAESGVDRLVKASGSQIAATRDQAETVHWWSNTVDNLSTIRYFRNDTTATTGSAKLYKLKNPNTVADRFNLPFKMIKEVAVSGDFSAGHTFSGLEGDKVLMYKLEWIGEGGTNIKVRPNNDSGTNYDRQYLRGVTSSASASSNTGQTSLNYKGGTDASENSFADMYIYPQAGENRPCLTTRAHDEDTMEFEASWWNDSASEITSLVVYASNSNTCTGTLRLSYIPLPE